jgi:hypothetical protein
MATYTYSGLIGAGFDLKTSSPTHKLGTIVPVVSDVAGNQNRYMVYVYSAAVIGNSNYATIDFGTLTCNATSVDGGAGTAYFRNGSVAFAAGEYGWLLSTTRIVPNIS